MVLDRYFVAKTRLKEALPALRAVNGRAAANSGEGLERCISGIEKLREGFRVVVVGASGSGKSTLVRRLKAEISEESLSLGAIEPAGIEMGGAFGAELDQADAVICVLDAVEPWCRKTWGVLSKLPNAAMEKALIVVARCDMRSSGELAPILKHIDEELRQRTGETRTVVPVSARLAELARGDCADGERLRANSGMSSLVQALGVTLAMSTDCLGDVESAADAGGSALRELQAKLNELSVDSGEPSLIRNEIQHLSESLIAQTASRLSPVINSVDGDIMAVVVSGEEELMDDFERVREGKAESLAVSLQLNLHQGVRDATENAFEEAASRVEGHLDKSWDRLLGHVKEQAGGVPLEEGGDENSWAKQRREFIDAGRERVADGREPIDIADDVADQLRRPAAVQRQAFIWGALILAGAAVACYFQQWIVAGVCGVCSVVPWLFFRHWLRNWRKEAARRLWDALDSHRARIEQVMAEVVQRDAEIYFDEFRSRISRVVQQAENIQRKNVPGVPEFEKAEIALAEVGELLRS